MSRPASDVLRALLAQPLSIDIDALCFPEQAALVRDPSRNVVVVAGRRGGKSNAGTLKCALVAQSAPRLNCLYIGATQASVEKIAWRALLDFNRKLRLGGNPRWSDKSLELPNGSMVYLMAADTEKAAEYMLGIPKLALAIVDEMQRLSDDVAKTLVRDVLRPALRDVRGTLWLMGTPNRLGQVGVLWERLKAGVFSAHTWTIYENTKLGTREETEAIIEEDLKAEGETKDSAFFQSQYLARWVVDEASRAYRFDDALNIYETLPRDLSQCILAVDIGATDADAIADLAWSEDDPTQHLRSEDITTNQTVTELGDKLSRLADLHDPLQIVVDAGGGGKKTLITLQAMLPQLPLVAAVKPELRLQVKALNNRLRHGLLKVQRGSRFESDIRRVGWVKGVAGGKIDEVTFHSDIIPAVRYGVMASRPFLPDLDERTPEERERDARLQAKAERMRESQRIYAGATDDDQAHVMEMDDDGWAA